MTITGDNTLHHVNFVTVGWYWNPMNAWMVRNRLADEEITAFVTDEFLVTTYWLYANAIGGIKVQVPYEQLGKAQAVLARSAPEAFAIAPRIPTEDEPTCPRCGSTEISRERYAIRFVFLLLLLFGVPIPVRSSATECFDCGAYC